MKEWIQWIASQEPCPETEQQRQLKHFLMALTRINFSINYILRETPPWSLLISFKSHSHIFDGVKPWLLTSVSFQHHKVCQSPAEREFTGTGLCASTFTRCIARPLVRVVMIYIKPKNRRIVIITYPGYKTLIIKPNLLPGGGGAGL